MRQSRLKKIIIFVLFVFLFSPFFSFLNQEREVAYAASPLAVSDYTNEALNTTKNIFDKMWQAWEKWESAHKELVKHATEVAYKAALNNFLQKLAIETATWIASGGHGQKPLIFTKRWRTYLSDAADRAAGTFIMTWASSYGNQQVRNTKGGEYDREVTKINQEYKNCVNNCVNSYLKNSPVTSAEEKNYSDCINKCIDTANKENADLSEKFYKGETAGTAGRAYGNGIASEIINFVCQPSLNLRLKLSAGLANIESPAPPLCTYSKAKKNWKKFLNSKDFLNKFSYYWDPSENDLGIALTMHSSFLASRQAGISAASLTRQEGKGWKAVTSLAGKILTPAGMVEKMGYKPITSATRLETVDTHDIVANAIATFATTLMGRVLHKWIMKGLVSLNGSESGSGSEFNWSNFFNNSFQSNNLAAVIQQRENQNAAKSKYRKIFQTGFNKGRAYSILSKLVLCPDPNNPGPTDCVIDNNFAEAIQEHLTVEQAIKDGYINKNLPFGFYANGFQPKYNEGYPYRSLIILRKYRIIPVGWEIAALYIGKILAHSDHPRTYNIQEIIDHYNDPSSPFYKLIDPNWVLKAPEVYCAREGYGEQLLDEEVSKGININSTDTEERIPSKLIVARAKYCADERSCIKTDNKGNCLFYGYCTKEKRIWDFQGDKCDSKYNTCQTFTNPAGDQVSYLKRSLDFSNCNAQNAGCRWYCQWRNTRDSTWMCKAPGVDLRPSDICLNLKGCVLHDTSDLDQDGNTAESCTVPYRGMSCKLKSGARLVMQPNKSVARKDNAIYLNGQASSCPARAEGCHEFYRTKEGLGTNLLINPSFEATTSASSLPGWTTINGKQVTGGFAGQHAFGVSALGSLKQTVETGRPIGGRKFVFSFYAKNCSSATTFQIIGASKIKSLKAGSQWQRFSLAYMFPSTDSHTEVSVQIANIQPGCLIDAAQLEEVPGNVNQPSQYKDYGAANVIYLKKAPEYYHCDEYTKVVPTYTDKTSCLAAGHFWRDDIQKCVQGGSAQCAHFALECSLHDVGCDLYTPANGDPAIPAVVHSNDYCPAQCVGYNSYKQVATFFTQEKFPEFFIPQYEKNCSAQFAGCSEFTNLDKLKKGGEAVEDFTYLRPCHKVDGDCATFYTWVGSDTTGYQLKSYSLVDANHDGVPDTIYSASEAEKLFGSCSSEKDVLTNPECYKFYSMTGKVTYLQYKNTIACSNDCHPFRKTISTPNDCAASHGKWLNGYCFYEGLESQSIHCPASQVGCYEFKGNTSANVFRVIDDTFEDGVNNWNAGTISSESLVKGGHSLKVTAGTNLSYELKDACVLTTSCTQQEGCACKVAGKTKCYVEQGKKSCVYKSLVVPGRTYLLSFWAKGKGTLTIKFSSAPNGDEFSKSIFLSPEWTRYTLGPVFVNWNMDSDDPVSVSGNKEVLETFEISGFTGDSYLDNILLKEVRSDLFIIKPKLWHVPKVCDEDYNGNYAPQYMLGCQRYHEKVDGNDVYLKSFNHLCQEDLIGCEPLIDTFNTASPFAQKFNVGDPSEIDVPADKLIALVNSPQNTCEAQYKGCMAVGLAQYKYNMHKTPGNLADDTDDLFSYQTKYLINNPENYSKTLCQAKAVGCDKFTSQQGNYYFHNPLAYQVKDSPALCIYKSAGLQKPGWYIVGTQSGSPNCPLTNDSIDVGLHYPGGSCLGGPHNGEFCAQDSDCPGGKCFHWAGVCPDSANSCTQYIDPLSAIRDNIVFNGDFGQDVDGDGVPDGWTISSSWKTLNFPLYLKDHTLYSIVASNSSANPATVELYNCSSGLPSASISFASGFAPQDISLTDLKFPVPYALTSPNNSLAISANGTQGDLTSKQSKFVGLFYSNALTQCQLRVSGNVSSIKIYPTGIYYYLDKSLAKGSCQGNVDYKNGCVLFAKRDVENGGSFSSLTYDVAKNNKNVTTPQSCSGSSCNANILLKALPDRTCGNWLYCKSYIIEQGQDGKKRKVCLKLGLCDSLNAEGVCNDFPVKKKENVVANQTVNLDSIKDMDGYVNVGELFTNGTIKGELPFSVMEEKGNKIKVPNGSFELLDNSGQPLNWSSSASDGISVIDNPVDAQKNGLPLQAPDGRNFLKILASSEVNSDNIYANNLAGDYFLSAYINVSQLSSDLVSPTPAKAYIEVDQYDSNNTLIFTNQVIAVDASPTNEDKAHWQHLTGSFSLKSGTSYLKIKIYASNAIGNFYVDDIQIMPVLQVTSDVSPEYVNQSCRAYPKSDSLSCDYIDQNGIREIGWEGYCLLHDLPPGNPKQCLLWYPLGKTKGSINFDLSGDVGNGIKVKYTGPFPVYYTLQATTKRIYEYRHAYCVAAIDNTYNYNCKDHKGICPSGYKCEGKYVATDEVLSTKGHTTRHDVVFACIPDGSGAVGQTTGGNLKCCLGNTGECGTFSISNDGFYPYDGSLNTYYYNNDDNVVLSSITIDSTNEGQYAKYLCHGASSCTINGEIPRVELYATEIAQTVTSLGDNTYWANRVTPQSTYNLPYSLSLLPPDYTNQELVSYSSDVAPFGSIAPPDNEANDPASWSLLNYLFGSMASGARLGQPLQCVPAEGTTDCQDVVNADNDDPNLYPYDAKDMSSRVSSVDLGRELAKRIFAQSYGIWRWNGSGYSEVSNASTASGTSANWLPPNTPCPNGVRPSNFDLTNGTDYCAIPPKVENFEINGVVGDALFSSMGFAKLTFQAIPDKQQYPIVRYTVDWGDGDLSTGSGSGAHILYHIYNYNDMASSYVDNGSSSSLSWACAGAGKSLSFTVHGTSYSTTCPINTPCCATVPSINIQDNWGWCNHGTSRGDCNNDYNWDKYGGIIKVTEF